MNKFSWLKNYLLIADVVGVPTNLAPGDLKEVINRVWDAHTFYLVAEDDEYNYSNALETYQILENGLMESGVDVELGIWLTMKRNGYVNFNQMKPNRPDLIRAFLEDDAPVAVGHDPWNN